MRIVFLCLALGAVTGCRSEQAVEAPVSTTSATPTSTTADPETQKLQRMAARFAPVDLTVDLAALPPNERQALAKIVEASRVFDTLFLRQVWSGNEKMLQDLSGDSSPLGRARLHYFMINKGPWSRIDHNEPFIAGVPPKPPQANFYSSDSKAEVEAWFNTLKGSAHADAVGFFTTIRRNADGKFVAVPYSVEYKTD